ncbi:hypothetical protein [Deinococcus multiflagellatus]|uniref:Uncharacterized protein n=1 Tax=Deinococcus multiflagellatus TaxID=1656887 RepID=A0ABW1ZQL8_9DEIO|nr:hypothetical protein [Deinococcus multiflagellatus]MBZ9715641.1 hypothetical protein [Deinococcus multiflagellatus]
MQFLVVTGQHLSDSTSGQRRWWSSADYLAALTQFRQWEREVQEQGFVLIAEVAGHPGPEELAAAARNLTLTSSTVMRSALGPALATAYAQIDVPIPHMTATTYADLNAQKYLLLQMLDGAPLSGADLMLLRGLVDFLNAIQDRASYAGVPDAVVWPNVPFGVAVEQETQLVGTQAERMTLLLQRGQS